MPHRFLAVFLLIATPGCLEFSDDLLSPSADPDNPFLSDPFFLDTLLEWQGNRHDTLGSTGERLYADQLRPGPGMLGRFGYLHHSEEQEALQDLFRLTFTAASGQIEPVGLRETWRPSYHETGFNLLDVEVVEKKFIRDDDTAVALLTFSNEGEEDRSLGVSLESSLSRRAGFRTDHMVPIDFSILANRALPAGLRIDRTEQFLILGGIPFVPIDPTDAGDREALGLRGRSVPPDISGLPRALEIPINRKVRRLHFLGQIGEALTELPAGTRVGRYVVYYETGPALARDLLYQVNCASSGRTEPLTDATGHDGLFVYTIAVNPSRAVRFVRFESSEAGFAPALVALTAERADRLDGSGSLTGSFERYGVSVTSTLIGELRDQNNGLSRMRVRHWNRADHSLEGTFVVPAGSSVELRIAAGLAGDLSEAHQRTSSALAVPDPLSEHRSAYHRWFEANCPRFASGDDYLDKLWWYRWFVVRHNLARPAAGNLADSVFYEGKHGNWYPRLISFASPHIIAETRWLADPAYARNQILAHLENAAEDGLIQSATTDWKGGFYNHWIAKAALDLDQAHPDLDFLKRITPALDRDLAATLSRYDADGDFLPAAPDLYATGMEYQPSSFYFDDFDNTRPPVRLERPDFCAYVYGSARAIETMYRRLGRSDDGDRLASLAENIQQAALDRLWNPAEELFLSIREEDDKPAISPEVVAFYPWFTGLVPDQFDYARSFNHLLATDRFRTPVPFASTSQEVPVFSASIENWPGPGGHVEHCMWNGPVWPHANSVVAMAMGETLLNHRQHDLRPDDLKEFLEAYAMLHFEDGDLARPIIRETADAVTGAQWGCPDYFHSTWIDLVCRYHDLVGWPSPTPPPEAVTE